MSSARQVFVESRFHALARQAVFLWLCAGAFLFLAPGHPPVQASDRVQIAEAIPSDVALYFHCRVPQSAGWARRFGKLREALSSPAFLSRYWERHGGEGADKLLKEEVEYWRRILSETPAWKLFAKEFAFAIRLEGKSREWVAVFKVASEDRDALLMDLRRILLALSGLVPNVEAVVSTRKGVPVTVLYHDDIAQGEEICTGGVGEAVVMTSNAGLLRHTLQLLAGESSDLPFVHSKLRRRFHGDGAPAVDAAGWVEFFVQPKDLFHDVRLAQAWEALAFTGEVRGETLSGAFQSTFAQPKRAADKLLRRTFLERPGLKGLQSWLPAGAEGFEVSSGWDPVGVYTLLTQVGDAFHEGDLDELLDGDPRWRVLSLMTGRLVMAKLAEGWGGVVELNEEVRKNGKARLVGGIQEMLSSWNLRWRPRESAAEGIWRVVEPESGDRALFHVGIVDAQLVIASSPVVAEKLLSGKKSDGLDFSASPWSDRQESHCRIAEGKHAAILLRATALSLSLLSHQLSGGEPAEFLVGSISGWLGEALLHWDLGAIQKSYTIRDGNQVRGVMELHLED